MHFFQQKKILIAGGFLCLAFACIHLGWVFLYTPIEINQGIAQKIMYVHVPSILTAYFFIGILFFSSLGYLLKNKEGYDLVAQAAAEIAVLNLFLALITGSLWGKPTWNTYWTWDARLTLTLIMFLLFCGYLTYRKLGQYSLKTRQGSGLIAILGFFSIPLNHLAVKWFRSIHQPSTLFASSPKIDAELYYPLVFSIVFFLVFFLYFFWLRFLLEQKKRSYLSKIFT